MIFLFVIFTDDLVFKSTQNTEQDALLAGDESYL